MESKIFKFPERAEEVKKNYQRLNLEGNPFPLQGLASRDAPFVPYPERTIEAISTFVTDAVGSKGYHGLPIVGDYGSGKTRLLFVIEKEISTGIVGCSSTYIDEPPADIRLFYEKILDRAPFENILKMLSLGFEKTIAALIVKNLERVPSLLDEERYFLKEGGTKLVEQVSTFLAQETSLTSMKDIAKAYAVLLLDYFVSNIMNASKKMKISLVNSVIAENGPAWQYIIGKRASKELYRRLNFTDKEISKADICGGAFKLFISICGMAGVSVLFILIDEFEEIIEKKTNREILNFLNDFRSLMNNNVTSDFAIILSCTPEAWIKANQLSPGFSERFVAPTDMPALDPENALRITSAYLSSKRIKRPAKDSIEPFDKDAVRHLLKISDYKIRDFIRNCNIVLTSLSTSREEIINTDFVDRVLKASQVQGPSR